ncbi:hypothetical protein M2157_000480 [Streptomyces sp. SAI-127]|nr:hypothetical protein [Streptomyces sp. SAI-127]
MEDLIAEAASRGEMSPFSIDSTIAGAHRDAAGMYLGQWVCTALEKAAAEEEKARLEGAAPKNRADATPKRPPSGRNGDGFGR